LPKPMNSLALLRIKPRNGRTIQPEDTREPEVSTGIFGNSDAQSTVKRAVAILRHASIADEGAQSFADVVTDYEIRDVVLIVSLIAGAPFGQARWLAAASLPLCVY